MRWWSPLLLLAGLSYLVLAVYWTDSNRHAGTRHDSDQVDVDEDGTTAEVLEPESDIFDPFSVFNLAPEGLSQAFEFLRRRPGAEAVEVLGRRISVDDLPRDGVVFRVDSGWLEFPTLMELLEDMAEEAEDDAAAGDEDTETEDSETEDTETADVETDGGEAVEPEAEGTETVDVDSTGSDSTDSGSTDSGSTDSDAIDDEAAPTPARWKAPQILAEREVAWVRGGGRLVLAFEGETTDLVTRPQPKGELRKVFPLWPAVRDLQPPVRRVLGGEALRRTHAVVLLGDEPMISRWPMGRGEILLVACPEVLQNAHLATGDHLALLQALAGEGRAVYFDETLHGTEHDLGTFFLLGRWRLIPGLILWLLACLAMWWRHSRAVGPLEDPYQEQRSEAVDMVDSLASLYARALRRRDALELYHRAFVEHVGWRFGLKGDALTARAEDILGGPLSGLGMSVQRDISAGDLHRQLERINQAFRRIEHADRF